MNAISSKRNWTRTLLWAAAFTAALALTSGCNGDDATPPASPGGQTPNPPAQGQAPGQQPKTPPGQGQAGPGQPAANVKLTPLTYGEEEKQVIISTAKTTGVKTIYVPQQGAPDDKLNQVQGGGKQMNLQFYKMAVTESSEEIKPAGTVESQQDVKLKIGAARWITAGGQPTLYMKLNDTYIAISSAKAVSPEEIQAIAETLTPLK